MHRLRYDSVHLTDLKIIVFYDQPIDHVINLMLFEKKTKKIEKFSINIYVQKLSK